VHAAFLREFASDVRRQFWRINLFVLAALAVLLAFDITFFLKGWIAAEQRIIGERTMLALIAGSTAQLGALAIAIGRGLFAGRTG